MFFQEPPPDTSGYMIAGYIIAFVVMGIYLLSLVVRWRNLTRDLEALGKLQEESAPRAGASRKVPRKSSTAKK
jgi:hypothetical protein